MTDSAPVSRHELNLLDRSITERFNGLDRWVEGISSSVDRMASSTEKITAIDHRAEKISSDLARIVHEYEERLLVLEQHKNETSLRMAKILGGAAVLSTAFVIFLEAFFKGLIAKVL